MKFVCLFVFFWVQNRNGQNHDFFKRKYSIFMNYLFKFQLKLHFSTTLLDIQMRTKFFSIMGKNCVRNLVRIMIIPSGASNSIIDNMVDLALVYSVDQILISCTNVWKKNCQFLGTADCLRCGYLLLIMHFLMLK